MNDISIEQIRPELTWRLRKEVLYPTEPMYAMEMEEDNHGYHFAAFDQDQLIAVISLFQKDSAYQFRKFAVAPAYQCKGIGTLVMDYITTFVKTGDGTLLWCNARISAVGFYQKRGFSVEGNEFIKKGITYVIMEKHLS